MMCCYLPCPAVTAVIATRPPPRRGTHPSPLPPPAPLLWPLRVVDAHAVPQLPLCRLVRRAQCHAGPSSPFVGGMSADLARISPAAGAHVVPRHRAGRQAGLEQEEMKGDRPSVRRAAACAAAACAAAACAAAACAAAARRVGGNLAGILWRRHRDDAKASRHPLVANAADRAAAHPEYVPRAQQRLLGWPRGGGQRSSRRWASRWRGAGGLGASASTGAALYLRRAEGEERVRLCCMWSWAGGGQMGRVVSVRWSSPIGLATGRRRDSCDE